MMALFSLARPNTVGRTFPVLKREFRVTRPNNGIPPFVLIFVRPAMKVVAFFAGRRFRNWWKSLPSEKREEHYQKLKSNRKYIAGGGALMIALSAWYYNTHSQETPITKRKRFVMLTMEQLKEISKIEFKTICQENFEKIVPPNHPIYIRVANIINRILQANKTLPEIYTKNWTITVLNDPDVINAFVLPNGNIFVFSGLLDLCKSEDELGIVLGHEMAHSLMCHAVENVTRENLVEWLKILLIGLSWAFLPTDLISYIFYAVAADVADITLQYPYSRLLENEADEVGLVLAAKACFDVRSASAFWSKLETISQLKNEMDIEWLSTHPKSENRLKNIEARLPDVLKLRIECECPDLPAVDPRHEVEAFKNALLESQNVVKPVAISLALPDITKSIS